MPQARPARPNRPAAAPYGNAYGLRNYGGARSGMVGPVRTGADDGGAMQWLSDNKWYVAGGLLLAAGLAGLALSKR